MRGFNFSINGVNYSFRKHEVGYETARDGCQVRLVNEIYVPLKIHFAEFSSSL
jgi:hypothetical protein